MPQACNRARRASQEMGGGMKSRELLEKIRDLLFLDIIATEQFYNMSKEQNAEIWEEITTLVQEHFKMESVECSLCGNDIWTKEAHLHQDDFIGPCCWDDRLKSSE